MIYVILDNLNHHKGPMIRAWCADNAVELAFTPTYGSWANPIEAHFGPLREFSIANSDHQSHAELARAIRAYIRWRNAHTTDPEILALFFGLRYPHQCHLSTTALSEDLRLVPFLRPTSLLKLQTREPLWSGH